MTLKIRTHIDISHRVVQTLTSVLFDLLLVAVLYVNKYKDNMCQCSFILDTVCRPYVPSSAENLKIRVTVRYRPYIFWYRLKKNAEIRHQLRYLKRPLYEMNSYELLEKELKMKRSLYSYFSNWRSCQ